MRPILTIPVQVEWQDLDHARVLAVYIDVAIPFDRMNKYEEIVFNAVDDKFNPL